MNCPNILLIHSDQHRYDCVGGHGHPLLKTPAMDRLAAEGVDCTHSFCPIPLCVPARASLMSGQFPTGHLGIANFDTEAPRPFNDDVPLFSHLLNEAGYNLGYVGKWHLHPTKDARDYGFHEYVGAGQYGKWRREQGLEPMPRENAWLGELDPHIAPEQSRLGWGASNTIDLLKKFAASDSPFFLRWDPPEPHLPNVVPEPYHSMYPPSEIEPWPSFPDSLEGKPYIQRQQLRTWGLEGWSWEQWAPVVSRYLGDISLLDAQIGRILDALERLGLEENTLVIYTTDHGDMCGAHGMIDKHFIMYDDVVRVPMIARWPEQLPAGSSCDAFIASAVDLAATFCDVAGVPIPKTFQGQSLIPVLRGETDGGRDDIFSMYHGNQFGLFSQRMVRTRRWKYVWNATAEDELYDLENDLGELQNLATDSAQSEVLADLRRRLIRWMEETNDLLLNRWTKPQIEEGRTI
ncbi:MAG: sulfatase-like hydrolase/transferase [Planctomycetota bacterium]|jgi:arylsulfatase A-like enzyme|nr:sulfatase-like hydrolase/transferase [Planctomycetota bacterium]